MPPTSPLPPKRKKAGARAAPASITKRATTKAGKAGAASARGDGDPPRFGLQLRHYRLMRKLKLKELAALADCSESLLSRVENNQLNPSLTTLHRLCKVLDISMANMVTPHEPEKCHVTRPGQRQVVGRSDRLDAENSEAELFIPYAEGRLLEGRVVAVQPGGGSNGMLSHRGEEVGYVLEGALELWVDGETHAMGPGCTFYFRSELQHAYRNPGQVVTRIVWINTPPTF